MRLADGPGQCVLEHALAVRHRMDRRGTTRHLSEVVARDSRSTRAATARSTCTKAARGQERGEQVAIPTCDLVGTLLAVRASS
jgi:hypothetical protein